MAKNETKTGKAGDDQNTNTNTANATAGGDENTKAGSGETNAGGDQGATTKSSAAAGDENKRMTKKPFVTMPCVFLPGTGDEVCRHNGATRNVAFCTKVVNDTTINLQAVPDGGALQWRIDVEHKNNAAPGADAWCHFDELDELEPAAK